MSDDVVLDEDLPPVWQSPARHVYRISSKNLEFPTLEKAEKFVTRYLSPVGGWEIHAESFAFGPKHRSGEEVCVHELFIQRAQKKCANSSADCPCTLGKDGVC